jgi:mRNA interferase MazF
MGRPLFPKRGEIWLADFNRKKEKEVNKIRPVLIISKDTQNEFSEKITVTIMTTDEMDNLQPVEVYIDNTKETGLNEPSKILMNYPYTIKKQLRLIKRLGVANPEVMEQVKIA